MKFTPENLIIVFTLLNPDKMIYRSQYEQNYKKNKVKSFWLFTLVNHMIYCEWKIKLREWIPYVGLIPKVIPLI